MGHDRVLVAISMVRKLETVAWRSRWPSVSRVHSKEKLRSSQLSGWSCHTTERAGSNFNKVSRFNDWFVLNIFFASAAVDSDCRREFCCCFERLEV